MDGLGAVLTGYGRIPRSYMLKTGSKIRAKVEISVVLGRQEWDWRLHSKITVSKEVGRDQMR